MKFPLLELFLAELRRTWIQFIRYPSEAIVGIFIIVITFYFLFAGASYIAGPDAGLSGASGSERLEVLVVGYIISILVISVLSTTSNSLEQEASTGTLEQIFLSPFRSLTVFIMRAFASLSLRLVIVGISLTAILLITGTQLRFPLALVMPLGTLLMSAYGMAFAVAGLVLVVKRVSQVLGAVQFGLFLLLGSPVETMEGWGRAIAFCAPMVPSAGLLRDLMARELPLNWELYGIALANALFYLGLGFLLFARSERIAKQRGLLSGY